MKQNNHISSFFINRPVTTILITASIIIFGIFAYLKLPVNDLPTVDFPTIEVTANLPGASPETMASAVALPLEKEFSTIDGITSMVSTNTKGTSKITIQFKLEKDIDVAAQDIQTMISKALRNLPSDMTNPPSFRKVNPADLPIFYIAVSSKTLPLYKVHEYADTFIAQQLSTISGVAQVSIYNLNSIATWLSLYSEHNCPCIFIPTCYFIIFDAIIDISNIFKLYKLIFFTFYNYFSEACGIDWFSC